MGNLGCALFTEGSGVALGNIFLISHEIHCIRTIENSAGCSKTVDLIMLNERLNRIYSKQQCEFM